MAKRRSITKAMRTAIFERRGGVCHLCKMKVIPGEKWDVSHEIPLAIGGKDDESNWDVAHRKCHRVHTSEVDIPRIAKTNRQRANHIGAVQEKPKIPARPKAEKPIRDKLPLPARTHDIFGRPL